MVRRRRLLWLSACAPFLLGAAGTLRDLTPQIEALRARYPIVQRARFGYEFVSLDSGEVLSSVDASTFFTPASNTKLYTTSCALKRLGPDHRFHTELRTSGSWQPGQSRVDNLELIGGGDTNLSGRAVPYMVDIADDDPLRTLKLLASQVYDLGIREITGDVVGDAQRYPGDWFPDGWTLDDSDYSYGAPVSALTLNDSTAILTLRPTQPGELAEVELRPGGDHFLVSNQVVTVPGKTSKVGFHRPHHSNEIVLTGTIGQDGDSWTEEMAADDPALWTTEALVGLLRERGIAIHGEARTRYADIPGDDAVTPASPTGTLLLSHESAPLSQIIQVVNKVSQNLHAEMLLRELAISQNHPGTLANGLKERQACLAEAEVTATGSGFAFADGSGLARQDLTTPDSTTHLLRAMWTRPDRDSWLASLPVGGFDGSLRNRFKALPGAQRVHAKTGSLSHVNALSGYIETRTRGWLAFSIMVNGSVGRDSEVRDFLDQLCALFAAL